MALVRNMHSSHDGNGNMSEIRKNGVFRSELNMISRECN